MSAIDFIACDRLLSAFPGVSYECTGAFEVVFISRNIVDLIGIDQKHFIGNRSLWEEHVFDEDRAHLLAEMEGLEHRQASSCIHRFVDCDGLPVWVCHRMMRVEGAGGKSVHGSLIHAGHDKRVFGLDPSVGSVFAHKLANQFQIQGMLLSSLRRSRSESKELEVLQESLDKAIDLARAFSQLNQFPARADGVRVLEVMEPALTACEPAFRKKNISMKVDLHPSLNDVSLSADIFLLDSMIRSLLQHVLEGIEEDGSVTITGSANSGSRRPTVRLKFLGSGRDRSGSPSGAAASSTAPYLSSKKAGDGFNLSVASRIVELHDGSLRTNLSPHEGLGIEIVMPAQC